jgi:hypothetical protein
MACIIAITSSDLPFGTGQMVALEVTWEVNVEMLQLAMPCPQMYPSAASFSGQVCRSVAAPTQGTTCLLTSGSITVDVSVCKRFTETPALDKTYAG